MSAHHLLGLISSFLAGKKIVEYFLYVKETVELVPEHPHRTHRVNPSSITSESSIGTMVMFLSLDKFQTFSRPKLGGGHLTPWQRSVPIWSANPWSEALLDHIADFLKFISSPQSFWFSDTSYDHGCHLASRFRLDPEEYKALLIVAGLVSYARFGFHIKPNAWSLAGNVADMSRHVGDDTTCRSNCGPMGPCRRHKI